MSDPHITTNAGWVPQACTLPTNERPLRLAEFDRFFGEAVQSVARVSDRHLRFRLAASARVEAAAGDLVARESSCCSFFDFTVARPEPQVLILDVRVPTGHIDVLDALADRAAAVRSTR